MHRIRILERNLAGSRTMTSRPALRRGVCMMMLSSVFFSLMSAMVRELRDVNSFTTVMMRFVVGGLVVGVLFVSGFRKMRWRNWPWMIARGVTGGVACSLFYWGIQHIGLSKAVLLGYTYVIFASVFAVLILGEQIDPRHWLAIAAAAGGIAMVCGVQNLSGGSGEMIALLGGLVSGFAVVCVTKCRENDSSTNIFFSQCVFGVGIVALPTLTHWKEPTPVQWIFLALIGLLAAAGQLSMTYAYKFTGASYGSLLSLLTPILSAILGVVYFKETFGASTLVGSTLILVSCCYLSWNPVGRTRAESTSGESISEEDLAVRSFP
ncbi:MAG: DMT family transporter [Armatimonadetes bacterium]|nr:DMT family transporter [Armatimonadota bacterium]